MTRYKLGQRVFILNPPLEYLYSPEDFGSIELASHGTVIEAVGDGHCLVLRDTGVHDILPEDDLLPENPPDANVPFALGAAAIAILIITGAYLAMFNPASIF